MYSGQSSDRQKGYLTALKILELEDEIYELSSLTDEYDHGLTSDDELDGFNDAANDMDATLKAAIKALKVMDCSVLCTILEILAKVGETEIRKLEAKFKERSNND